MIMNIYIYGAKSIALGVCRAIQTLYPSHRVEGFLVSSLEGNPSMLAELPVREIGGFSDALTAEDKAAVHILIATPENIHNIILFTLKEYGFSRYTCINSIVEADLMERYYDAIDIYPSLHKLKKGTDGAALNVLTVKFYKDVALQGQNAMSEWAVPIQVGVELTDIRVADILDNVGENISLKNVNYCELTALYWMWKNQLLDKAIDKADYYGLFHYRRMLDVSDEDILRLKENDVDVILPFPMLHEPNALEHHTRYLREADWEAMLTALQELQPEYAKAIPEIFSKPYLYNYNMIIAKADVLADYCEWLFPILERTEELSDPKGWERADRYIGYLAENLETLYFMYNKDKYKVMHTGRRMLV